MDEACTANELRRMATKASSIINKGEEKVLKTKKEMAAENVFSMPKTL